MNPAGRAGKPGRPGKPRKAIRAAAVASAVLAIIALAAGCAAQPAPRTGGATLNPAHAGYSGNVRHEANGNADTAAGGASCNPVASSLAPSGPPNVSSGSFAATIRARGKLIAGVDQSTYHFGFLNPIDNQIEGFDIDMIDAVAHAIFGPSLQNRIEFKAIPDADRISDLQSGAVDIVAHTMTVTCPRLQQIDFSSIYYNAKAELLVLRNSSAGSLADLKGENVCATTGSDDLALIQSYHAHPVAVPYWTDCLVQLQQGQVAGVVTDDSILHGLLDQDPFTRIITTPLEAEPYGLGISKAHPDFVRFVNAVLAQVESNGQWEQDYKHWVSPAGQPPPVPRYAP